MKEKKKLLNFDEKNVSYEKRSTKKKKIFNTEKKS